jgi:type II secretory pathway predicted ATPase ExeA
MLAEFRFLNDFKADSFSPISLWLVGQSEPRETMKLRILSALTGRIQIRYHMTGLTESEVHDYIAGLCWRGKNDLFRRCSETDCEDESGESESDEHAVPWCATGRGNP